MMETIELIMAYLGSTPPPYCPCIDLDGDGAITVLDLLIALDNL